MENRIENGILIIKPVGSVDSNNADDFGKKIDETRNEHLDLPLILDFDELKYISSAGLRQILRLKKAVKDFKIINVSSEVYEVFEMTGFSEMIEIVKAYRKLSVDGCEKIGEGSNGIVYRINPDTIIKVYKNNDALEDIKRERELARTALIHGINTAIPYDVVMVDGHYGSVFELISAKSLTDLFNDAKDDEELNKYIKIFADTLKEIHSTTMEEGLLPSAKKNALKWASYLDGKIDNDVYTKLTRMIEEVPESLNVVHGDFHSGNVYYVDNEPIIIDMDTLSVGNPIFDFCNIYNAYHGFSDLDHGQVGKFLGINYDLAQKILNGTYKYYFSDKDDAYIEEAKKKAMVISYLRLLRRTLKREPDNTAMIDNCKTKLINLVNELDNLIL